MRTYVKAFLRVQITIQSRIINRAITRIRNRGTVYLLQKPTPTKSEPRREETEDEEIYCPQHSMP